MKSVVHEKTENIIVEEHKNSSKSKTPKLIITGILVLFLIASIYALVQNLNSSSINISACFSSVAEGKNPNGSPFDIDELLSDEVLQMASQKLDGKVDVQTLKNHLSVSDATSTADIANLKQKIVDGSTDYSFFPNVYTLTYSIVSDRIKNGGFLSSVGVVTNQIFMPGRDKILESVAQSYREYYFKKYIAGSVAMEMDWSDTDSLDYYNKANETKASAEKISRFIYSEYNKNPEYVSAEGIGYGDLYTEIEQIINIDVNNYISYIVQNGVTSDKDSLLRQFAYMEKLYNVSKIRHMSAYEITKDALGLYDSNTSRVVFVPALDEKRSFYMNRTKVGIDYLIEKASHEKTASDDAMHSAERYKYLAERFSNADSVSQETIDATDAMYIKIKGKINDFVKKAEGVLSEGSQVNDHEMIELGSPYANFEFVSVGVNFVKLFVALLLIAFLAVSLVQFITGFYNKRRMAGDK